MLVLKLENNKKPQLVEIEKNLKSYQDIVKGRIECPYITRELMEMNIDLVVNEEGNILGLEESLLFIKNREVVGAIFGNSFFVSVNNETGEFESLNEEQIKYLNEKLKFAEFKVVNTKNNRIITLTSFKI